MIVALFLELSLVLSRIVISELVEKSAFSVRKKKIAHYLQISSSLRCDVLPKSGQLVKNNEEKGKTKSIVTISPF